MYKLFAQLHVIRRVIALIHVYMTHAGKRNQLLSVIPVDPKHFWICLDLTWRPQRLTVSGLPLGFHRTDITGFRSWLFLSYCIQNSLDGHDPGQSSHVDVVPVAVVFEISVSEISLATPVGVKWNPVGWEQPSIVQISCPNSIDPFPALTTGTSNVCVVFLLGPNHFPDGPDWFYVQII